jgi:hypothetical protein
VLAGSREALAKLTHGFDTVILIAIVPRDHKPAVTQGVLNRARVPKAISVFSQQPVAGTPVDRCCCCAPCTPLDLQFRPSLLERQSFTAIALPAPTFGALALVHVAARRWRR